MVKIPNILKLISYLTEKKMKQSTLEKKSESFRMLARDKFQGEKDESRIRVELRSDFSAAG